MNNPEEPTKPVRKQTQKKVAHEGQLIDVTEDERYPRDAQSENYRAQVLAPVAGIPMLSLAPVGWVGAAPLVIPESRVVEVANLLLELMK